MNAQIDAEVIKAVAIVQANDAEQIQRVVRLYDSRYSDIYMQVSGLVRQ
jgi:hypothetical protein